LTIDKITILQFAVQKNIKLSDLLLNSLSTFFSLYEISGYLELQQSITSLFYLILPKLNNPDSIIHYLLVNRIPNGNNNENSRITVINTDGNNNENINVTVINTNGNNITINSSNNESEDILIRSYSTTSDEDLTTNTTISTSTATLSSSTPTIVSAIHTPNSEVSDSNEIMGDGYLESMEVCVENENMDSENDSIIENYRIENNNKKI
jgi:hypothetical protein